jgi:hypothetical protein
MIKNCQHQHKGKPHTQEKSQDAATSMEDAIADTVTPIDLRPNVYLTEEPAELHAKEAVRFHQDGRESYQVLARGVFT